jgi:hypothetical protein
LERRLYQKTTLPSSVTAVAGLNNPEKAHVDLPSSPIKSFSVIQVNQFLLFSPFRRLRFAQQDPLLLTKYQLPSEPFAAKADARLKTILISFVSDLCTSMCLRLKYLRLKEQGGDRCVPHYHLIKNAPDQLKSTSQN